MPGTSLVLLLQIVSIVISALAAGKLLLNGLYRRYRILLIYFIFYTLNGIWPLFVNVKSQLYLYIWVATEPISFLFYLLAVLELCKLVLEKHPGIYTLGRYAMLLDLLLSLGISLLSLLPRLRKAKSQVSRMVSYVLAADRGITFCLALFLILMLFFLSRYPVTLSR